jgi:hypothetical protein
MPDDEFEDEETTPGKEESDDEDPDDEESDNEESDDEDEDDEDDEDSDDEESVDADPAVENPAVGDPVIEDTKAYDGAESTESIESIGPTDEADGKTPDPGQEDSLTKDEAVDLPTVDDDVFFSREAWPDAKEEDFEEDAGDWSADDYQENSTALFGWREDFGQTSHDAYIAEGFALSQDCEVFGQAVLEQLGPGSTSIRLYEKDGAIMPRGFLNLESLAALAALYPLLDLSRVHVTVPKRPEASDSVIAEPRALPESLRNITPADCVDLRKHCTPVGDQGQTSRCAAFAWTHALEMLGNIQNKPLPPLSCSFTMLRFQHRQGDAKDFRWAWKGGDGTQGTWEPGKHILESGTCRQELWPDDRKEPAGSADAMESDAKNYVIGADTYDVTVDDMKRLLTAGLPVQISIATGEAFQDIGSDGVMKVAEKPSGQHGYHAMLCVGYLGNYFIIKNSWGADWGDGGYCYIPKKVLMDSEPEPVAIVPFKPKAPAAGTQLAATAKNAATTQPVGTTKNAPTRCRWCGSMVPPGAACGQCGGPLRQMHRCVKCKAELPHSGVLCPACGTHNG